MMLRLQTINCWDKKPLFTVSQTFKALSDSTRICVSTYSSVIEYREVSRKCFITCSPRQINVIFRVKQSCRFLGFPLLAVSRAVLYLLGSFFVPQLYDYSSQDAPLGFHSRSRLLRYKYSYNPLNTYV